MSKFRRSSDKAKSNDSIPRQQRAQIRRKIIPLGNRGFATVIARAEIPISRHSGRKERAAEKKEMLLVNIFLDERGGPGRLKGAFFSHAAAAEEQRRDYIDPTYELLIPTLPRARFRVGSAIYVDVSNALRATGIFLPPRRLPKLKNH